MKGAKIMGKDLKGKELGAGITQRKNGTYQGRYKDCFGKQRTIYSKKLPELRRKLAVKIAENENYTILYREIRQKEPKL